MLPRISLLKHRWRRPEAKSKKTRSCRFLLQASHVHLGLSALGCETLVPMAQMVTTLTVNSGDQAGIAFLIPFIKSDGLEVRHMMSSISTSEVQKLQP